MGIIMLSINYSEFNNLNSNCSFISNDCSHWYAVQTLAGQEKKTCFHGKSFIRTKI
jgi:hypothetical protein